MASPKLAEAVSDSSDFPPADVDSELNPPTKKKGLEVDPISSEVATSLEIKVVFGAHAFKSYTFYYTAVKIKMEFLLFYFLKYLTIPFHWILECHFIHASQNVVYCIFKERVEAEEKQKARGKKDDALQTLKTTIIVSGVILAVAGAIIAITKKLREKWTWQTQHL